MVAVCFVTEILTICMSVTLPPYIYAGAIDTREFCRPTHYTAMTTNKNKQTLIIRQPNLHFIASACPAVC